MSHTLLCLTQRGTYQVSSEETPSVSGHPVQLIFGPTLAVLSYKCRYLRVANKKLNNPQTISDDLEIAFERVPLLLSTWVCWHILNMTAQYLPHQKHHLCSQIPHIHMQISIYRDSESGEGLLLQFLWGA